MLDLVFINNIGVKNNLRYQIEIIIMLKVFCTERDFHENSDAVLEQFDYFMLKADDIESMMGKPLLIYFR